MCILVHAVILGQELCLGMNRMSWVGDGVNELGW